MTSKDEFLDLLKEEILSLINKVFNLTSKQPLISLNDLSNEFILKSLVLEIEPNIESTCGIIDLSTDNKFGIRYANFVGLTKSVYNFIEKNSDKLRDKTCFKSQILINDIINNNREQLILLGKMLIIMFTIAPNNDVFLVKINSLETTSQEIYINIVEEYLKSDNSINMSRFSEMNTSVFQQKSSFQYKYEDVEKENKKLRQQIGELNTKITELNKQNTNLDLKFKDCLRDLEMAKISTIGGVITAKESLENEELKTRVDNKDQEILEIKIKYDREIEKQNNEIYRLKETIDKLNYDILEYRQMKKEYDDLKIKVKELAKYKELCSDYNDLLSTIDARNRQLEVVNNEKRSYVSQIERLQKEIIVEKDRYRQLEYEKKKLEFDYNDMRADVSKMECQIKRKDTNININNISDVKKDMYDQAQDKYNFLDIDRDSIIFDLDKNKDERTRNLEKEINELRQEKQDILKNYKSQVEDIHKITEEKYKLVEEFDGIMKEKEKLLIEKGKLEIQIERLQLDIQKNSMNYNKVVEEKKILEECKKDLEDKIEIQAKEKVNLQKEIEVHKLQNHNLKLNLEKATNENKNLHSEMDSLKLNADSTSTSVSYFSKLKKSSPKNIFTSMPLENTDFLRNDIKMNNAQKDDFIRQCRDRIKKLEEENKALFAQITENQEKNRLEVQKKTEDLEFYRRSYEEQRNRVNREHELISSSLYELASQFMFLKKEMQKKTDNTSKI